jgi:hypothetical protein
MQVDSRGPMLRQSAVTSWVAFAMGGDPHRGLETLRKNRITLLDRDDEMFDSVMRSTQRFL